MSWVRVGPVSIFLVSVLSLTLLACGGGSGGGGGGSGKMVLIDSSVENGDFVAVNSILTFEFSLRVDPRSVADHTLQIREGPNYGTQVKGRFDVEGRFVRFHPDLPVLADLSDSGLKPGRKYRITVPAHPTPTVLTSSGKDRLRRGIVIDFDTHPDGSPGLYVDNFLDPAPPVLANSSHPDGAVDLPADAEIRLTFARRALHPATVTPENITLVLLERKGVPMARPVTGSLELAQTHDRVTVVYHPTFPIADDALYELKIDRDVTDLLGEEVPFYRSRFTVRDEPLRDREATWEFDAAERESEYDTVDSTASWDDREPGALCALFLPAGGTGAAGDLKPDRDLVLSPKDFETGVRTEREDGVDYDVYHFRTIEIRNGVTVRFAPPADGPNRPVKLLSLHDVAIDGVLSVNGRAGVDGEVYSLTASMPASFGGRAGPGGGHGATSYTGTNLTDAPRMGGGSVDLGGAGGFGGGVGQHYVQSGTYVYRYSVGGGGGGGGSREAGYDGKAGGEAYNSAYNGAGGSGGASATDRGFDPNSERKPNVGGGGGGAGGKGFSFISGYGTALTADTAGAGGGGGGAAVLQSGGSIRIGATGRLLAEGGNGGGTSVSWSYYGGAGGGGGGGSFVVRATQALTLESGCVLSVVGGLGGNHVGTYTLFRGGDGGDGGTGYLRLEAGEDPLRPGITAISIRTSASSFTYTPVPQARFTPEGPGDPSVGRIHWQNLGVFDPIFSKPLADDVRSTLFDDKLAVEVQMAVEDPNRLDEPDLAALDDEDADGDGDTEDTLDAAKVSEWTALEDIETLNGRGYRFLRVRITFTLDDDHRADHPLPYLKRLRIPYRF